MNVYKKLELLMQAIQGGLAGYLATDRGMRRCERMIVTMVRMECPRMDRKKWLLEHEQKFV